MMTKPRDTHGRKDHFVENALGVSDVNGEVNHADSAKSAVASDNDRHLYVELNDVLHPRVDVSDNVALDEV